MTKPKKPRSTIFKELKKGSRKLVAGRFVYFLPLDSAIGRFCKQQGFKLSEVKCSEYPQFVTAEANAITIDNSKIICLPMVFEKL